MICGSQTCFLFRGVDAMHTQLSLRLVIDMRRPVRGNVRVEYNQSVSRCSLRLLQLVVSIYTRASVSTDGLLVPSVSKVDIKWS
jgi:hypothetical protein